MKQQQFLIFLVLLLFSVFSKGQKYKLVWSEEFNTEGKVDTVVWNFEHGFVRNNEDQWYQEDNAFCQNGKLVIVAKNEEKPNPNYLVKSQDWRHNRSLIEYTSASINTRGKKEFRYGRFEIRAKIPTQRGAWPAIWTLGRNKPWPSNGEIDIMEYYLINNIPHVLANVAWGTDRPYQAIWDSQTVPLSEFLSIDPDWGNKFHVWRMDWTEEAIRLYLDDRLMNEILLKNTQNGSIGNYSNPFKQPHYILLNLAIGGDHGGKPDREAFPLRYEIDYVRVYQCDK